MTGQEKKKNNTVSTGGAGDATLEAAYSRAKAKSEELQRGAGSGEFANATRSRDYDEEPVPAPVESTEWPQGDVDKGRLDPEAGAIASGQLIAHRDRRAYLLDQAQKNQDANDELNFIQTEQNKRVGIVQNILQDPDVQREMSMVSAVADLEMHDQEEFLKGRDERRQMRQDKQRENKGLPPEEAPAKSKTGTAPASADDSSDKAKHQDVKNASGSGTK